MRKLVGVGVLVGVLVACGSDVAEEAGDMMRGAGEAIADAGAALADAAGSDAQALTDAGAGSESKARIVEQACDIVRTETPVPGAAGGAGPGPSSPTEQRFASIAVDAAELRSAWLCTDSPKNSLGCSVASTCTGAVVPKTRCVMVTPYIGEDDTLWVSCGGWTRARFVLEP